MYRKVYDRYRTSEWEEIFETLQNRGYKIKYTIIAKKRLELHNIQKILIIANSMQNSSYSIWWHPIDLHVQIQTQMPELQKPNGDIGEIYEWNIIGSSNRRGMEVSHVFFFKRKLNVLNLHLGEPLRSTVGDIQYCGLLMQPIGTLEGFQYFRGIPSVMQKTFSCGGIPSAPWGIWRITRTPIHNIFSQLG